MSRLANILSFTQFVKATPAQVFYAFTNATALREWLCDYSSAVPHPQGRLYMWWNSGYFTAGEFTSLEPEQKVAFTWRGRDEPGITEVTITLQAEENGSQIVLEHSGLGSGEEWQAAKREIEKGWVSGLENLVSVLETGQDLRFIRRPMLGVLLNDYSPEIAASMGVPVSTGIRLSGTVEGMGAHAAGLQNNDVIVAMGGKPLNTYSDLANILSDCRAGDSVEVVFYRDGRKQSVQMTLSGRPLPDLPSSGLELSEFVKQEFGKGFEELANLLEGVTEAEADHRPEPGKWTIKEILAHLILSERGTNAYSTELVCGQERLFDEFPDNFLPQVQAVVAAYSTVPKLLAALRAAGTENASFLAVLPAEFVARKGSYWRLAYSFREPNYHLKEHFEQMNAALASARG